MFIEVINQLNANSGAPPIEKMPVYSPHEILDIIYHPVSPDSPI